MIVIIQGRDDGGWLLHGSSVEGERLAISRYISKVELECFPGRYNGGVQKRKKESRIPPGFLPLTKLELSLEMWRS